VRRETPRGTLGNIRSARDAWCIADAHPEGCALRVSTQSSVARALQRTRQPLQGTRQDDSAAVTEWTSGACAVSIAMTVAGPRRSSARCATCR
jgi:hypothetical protein